jgi:hypothetical protein
MSDQMAISPADSKTVEELIPQALALGNSGKAAILDFFGVHLKRVFGEVEALLNESGELTNPAALLTQNFLSVGSANNNLADNDMVRPPNAPSTWPLTSVRAWVTRTSQPE